VIVINKHGFHIHWRKLLNHVRIIKYGIIGTFKDFLDSKHLRLLGGNRSSGARLAVFRSGVCLSQVDGFLDCVRLRPRLPSA
jgi:hypothetical protein